MALDTSAWLEACVAAFGDRVWLTTPDRTQFDLTDGTGLFVGYDRAFTLDVTDITTPAVAWGRGYGIFVLPAIEQPGLGEIRIHGAISGDFEFGVSIEAFMDDLTLLNFGEVRASTAVAAGSLEVGVARVLNAGILWGDWAVLATGLRVEIINAPGGLMHGESYSAIHMTADTGEVTNEGVIEGSSVAIESLGWLQLDNAGTISGGWAALDMSRGVGSQILNSGRFAGLLQGSGARDEVENSGWMEDLNLGAGDDLVRNTGHMGQVALGAGHDQFIAQAAGTQGPVRGGRGDDTLTGGAAGDRFQGGDGRDRLFGHGGADRLWGGEEADILEGGGAGDWLFGDNGYDTLKGQAGDDRLYGGDGGDHLYGGGGNDWLEGGDGADILQGGAGADVFVLTSATWGMDRILDFTPGEDHLKLSAAMTWIGPEAFSGQAGEVRWNGQAAWLEADRNGDGVFDWRAQLYNSSHQVTDQDFL
ncbi:hypothetical protein NX862_02730 [Rhodobacter sp. KR11]|uniref:calcium-binding protein n=1 Tax=Rhodobacter sp. KR11 TaxID=2974588 RepID=UPI0022228DE8|nr:hypothetical protein [Rhodobacter sp. KR11]MCW1917658.1 hypothetical protein [Rhodobacter sp. KR11]